MILLARKNRNGNIYIKLIKQHIGLSQRFLQKMQKTDFEMNFNQRLSHCLVITCIGSLGHNSL